MFKPYRIVDNGTCLLFEKVPADVMNYVEELRRDWWRFYVVTSNRGMCYYKHKVITVPFRTIVSARQGYAAYYLAHEVAHAVAGAKAKHGPEFMAKFKTICPPEFWHFELDYKPRNAASAGIGI